MRKKNLDWRCKLPRQFVKDTLRALAEARAGKLTPYEYGPGMLKKITLFLDFDGVLHPFLARSSAEAFCHLPRLERVLREFPVVQIVIASTQRESVPLAHLAQRFSLTLLPASSASRRYWKCTTPVTWPIVATVRFWRTCAAVTRTGWPSMTTRACFRLIAPNWSYVMMVFEKRKNGPCVLLWGSVDETIKNFHRHRVHQFCRYRADEHWPRCRDWRRSLF